jgi:hypothetical protein
MSATVTSYAGRCTELRDGLLPFGKTTKARGAGKKDQMDKDLFDKPVPALAIAIGLAFLTHRANANAARAIGVPVAAVALLAAGMIAVTGLRS